MSVATIKQEVPTANGFYLNYDVGRRTNRERLAPVVPTVTRVADPEEIEWLRWQSIRLEGAAPEEILAWAVDHYFPRFTMATGLGPEGCLIISMLAKIEPRVYVFNLDTGYQFPETLELRDRIADRYGIVVDLQQPALSVEEYEAAHGGPVYRTNPDQCCHDRKLTVLRRVAKDFDAWASGIRRDQSPCRADTPIVRWDSKFALAKISPLACWTKKDVWMRIVKEGIPYNPLHDCGYPSIGCRPCTRSVMRGEDERAGRWSGRAKMECGLHTR
ncbi:MAG: phosphoadenylyl-sulfate reductase [Thermoguttaceae bacterium]